MRAFERFLKYAVIHTTSSEESGEHPSFAGEWELARMLERELKEAGLEDVCLDSHCYVYGRLPATPGYVDVKPLGFLAHMDTSPDAPGLQVRPELHPDYDGGELILGTGIPAARVSAADDSAADPSAAHVPAADLSAADRVVLSPEVFPFLRSFKGETVITSDGTTLLGADDKAGIAEIMTMLEQLTGKAANGTDEGIPHGELWICFTPDEEIGEGVDHIDLQRFRPAVAYTVDGGDVSAIEGENFNAAGATVTFRGISIHPGEAKDHMVNAMNAAFAFHAMLPEKERPEHTAGREGFFHLTDMSGDVTEAKLHYLIRDFDRVSFEARKERLREAAAQVNAMFGARTAELEIRDSYFNMEEMIRPHRYLIEMAREAVAELGMVPEEVPIRGGTDGARLSFMGIPCPNLGTGGANYHGVYECITVERMDRAVRVLLKLVNKIIEHR